jgi:hypothetical protein
MREVLLTEMEEGAIYFYYQEYDGNRYLSYVKVNCIQDNTLFLDDVCPFLRRDHKFNLAYEEIEHDIEITYPESNWEGDYICIFEMDNDELLRHVVMETI